MKFLHSKQINVPCQPSHIGRVLSVWEELPETRDSFHLSIHEYCFQGINDFYKMREYDKTHNELCFPSQVINDRHNLPFQPD